MLVCGQTLGETLGSAARRYHSTMRGKVLLGRRTGLSVGLAALAVAWLPAAAAPPPATWLVTLLDGEAVVVDGLKRIAAASGIELGPGALIETTETTALLRLEGADQSSIDLGPGTRVMLSPPAQASRGGRVPALYLLQGWAKLTSRGSAPVAGFVTPGLEGGNFQGAVVLRVARSEQSVFAETARIELAERRTGGTPQRLAPGEFYRGDGSKPGNKPGSLAPRPEATWLKELPRAFRDTIALRAASL